MAIRAMCRSSFTFVAGAALLCACAAKPSSPVVSRCTSQTHASLEAGSVRYRRAIARARSWLDALHVDPLELRTRGLKGKKKLTELLDAYYRLWQIADPSEKAALLARIRAVVAVTYEARYHDLTGLADEEFKQDATSYLRTAVLMTRLGLDTRLYREEIGKVHPRLNAHMHRRGPHQRQVFHWYYRDFGLAEPFPLDGALERGVIARRVDPATLSSTEAYSLTHEVFVPYEFGERLDVDPFDAADKVHLRSALELLVPRYIERRDPDLVAELVSCLRFLRFTESPAYRAGVAYLLDSQHPDGSWGDTERARRGFGALGNYGLLLHTTMVAIEALTVVFHPPWNRGIFPGCGDYSRVL